MLDKNLLDIIVCPVCKGELTYIPDKQVLLCKKCKLMYPIIDGIPVLLKEEAKKYEENSSTPDSGSGQS